MADRKGAAAHSTRPAQRRPAEVNSATGASSPPISPARRAAFWVLEQLANGSAHSDDLLHGPALTGLSQADRNLATALVMGVLRWQIALEHRLLPLLARPDQPLPGPVQTALLLGAFQLLQMDRVPPHAALNESVELVRWAGEPQAAGLVNALLRKLAVGPREAPQPIVESLPAAAARLAHPEWLVTRWARHYGRAAALAVCAYDQSEPATGNLFIGASSSDAPVTEIAETAESPQAGDDSTKPAMDDGSRLVAELAAASHPHPASFWDCCAAPGGKTMIVAQRHPQTEVLATDLSPRRLRALAARLAAALPGRPVRTEVADAAASEAFPPGEEFNLILCDVPCSGTGTLARNPEIRHRLREDDLARQADRQQKILSSALSRLAPGGRLLYSTCSLEPEENEAVVEAVMRRAESKNINLLPVADSLQRLSASGQVRPGISLDRLLSGPYLRILPGSGLAGDGFFAALFERGVAL